MPKITLFIVEQKPQMGLHNLFTIELNYGGIRAPWLSEDSDGLIIALYKRPYDINLPIRL